MNGADGRRRRPAKRGRNDRAQNRRGPPRHARGQEGRPEGRVDRAPRGPRGSVDRSHAARQGGARPADGREGGRPAYRPGRNAPRSPDRREGRDRQGRGQWRPPPAEHPRERPQQVIRSKGRAGEVGLDGHLRLWLDPLELVLAETLQSRGGATVIQPRGERVGRILTIVGTLQRPLAVVVLDSRVREHAVGLRGRELYIQ